MWVARDKDGLLHLFEEEPYKSDEGWWHSFGYLLTLSESMLPEIKWKDEQPTKVRLIIDK